MWKELPVATTTEFAEGVYVVPDINPVPPEYCAVHWTRPSVTAVENSLLNSLFLQGKEYLVYLLYCWFMDLNCYS